jgi:peptidoglycan hydrolase CwlO-like protein
MKKLLFLSVFTFSLLLISCGLSADERNAINIEIRNAQNNKQQLETNLTNANAQLAVENDKMQQLKGFHIFRTPVEREAQIKNESIQIDAVQKQIQKIQVYIGNVQTQIFTLQAKLK